MPPPHVSIAATTTDNVTLAVLQDLVRRLSVCLLSLNSLLSVASAFLRLRVHAPRCFSNAKIALVSLQDGFAAAHLAPGSKNTLALVIMHNFQLSPPARGSPQRTATTSLPATSLIFSSRPLVPTTTLHRVLYRTCKYHYRLDQVHLLLLQAPQDHLDYRQRPSPQLTAPIIIACWHAVSQVHGCKSLCLCVDALFCFHPGIFPACTHFVEQPLTPPFTAATTITAKEDLSLVYELKIF
ncbi:hypothetical protein D6D25_08536 [Aureobasidium pullulans]|nr:hypothetical protein D6D25_08536 [Aureobasidium pullulans]